MKDWTYYDQLQRGLFEANPYKTTNGVICNLFLDTLQGAHLREESDKTPDDYLSWIYQRLEKKIEGDRRWGHEPRAWVLWLFNYVETAYYGSDDQEEWNKCFGDVCKMVRWAIEWNQLPYQERQEIKRLKNWNKLSEEEKTVIRRNNKQRRTEFGTPEGGSIWDHLKRGA